LPDCKNDLFNIDDYQICYNCNFKKDTRDAYFCIDFELGNNKYGIYFNKYLYDKVYVKKCSFYINHNEKNILGDLIIDKLLQDRNFLTYEEVLEEIDLIAEYLQK